MIDWLKLWCRNPESIRNLIESGKIKFKGIYTLNIDEIEVENYPLVAKWKEWDIEIKSPTWMQIEGSIHKYWNSEFNGLYGNGNDFKWTDLCASIIFFCYSIGIDHSLLTVHNLEFGVNIKPGENATNILKQVICYKNKLPLKPIDDSDGYFLEFKHDDYYFKMYDKGKQSRQKYWIKQASKLGLKVQELGNVIRIEYKVVNTGFYESVIETLSDLLIPEKVKVLGGKFDKILRNVVFDDETINYKRLSNVDSKHYLLMQNPKNWVFGNTDNGVRKLKSSTDRAREQRFKEIVSKNGVANYQKTLSSLANEKWEELLNYTNEDRELIESCNTHIRNLFGRFSHLNYMGNNSKGNSIKRCLSCNKDISNQKASSKYCSEKTVGKVAAQKCRNEGKKLTLKESDSMDPKNIIKRRVMELV